MYKIDYNNKFFPKNIKELNKKFENKNNFKLDSIKLLTNYFKKLYINLGLVNILKILKNYSTEFLKFFQMYKLKKYFLFTTNIHLKPPKYKKILNYFNKTISLNFIINNYPS